MRSTALIHTVKNVTTGFNDSLRNYLGYEVKTYNLWDDFLTNNPNEVREFIIQNHNRLLYDMKAQGLTGADIIVTACSMLTPTVELVRPFVWIPVIATDDVMTRRSVLYGECVMVMATAEGTAGPTVSRARTEADKAGREADTSTCVCMDAFHTIKATNMKKHDMTLREKARELRGYDCTVLAQVSMARLEDETASITGCLALTSSRLCMEEIKNKLEGIQR